MVNKSRFRAVCRSRVQGSHEWCDLVFTDGKEWQRHRANVHRVYPLKAARVLTDPIGFRPGPVLSRIVKRKPDPRVDGVLVVELDAVAA